MAGCVTVTACSSNQCYCRYRNANVCPSEADLSGMSLDRRLGTMDLTKEKMECPYTISLPLVVNPGAQQPSHANGLSVFGILPTLTGCLKSTPAEQKSRKN